MRKVLSVVLGVVLTALALTVVGASTASANTPTPSVDICISLRLAVTTAQNANPVVPAVVQAAKDALAAANCGSGHNNGDSHNCGRYEHWNGDRCVRDGVGFPNYPGQTYNNCGDYNRNGIYGIRRGDPRYNSSWDRGNRGIVCENTTIINNGDCTTYVTNNRTYGDLYNRNYSSWNNLRLRDSRHQSLTAEQRAEIARLNRDMNTWYGNWNQSRNSLQTVCNQQPTVQIVQVPTPAPVTVTQQAPAPVYSGGSNVPRGSVETGYVS